jgi:hypothetical protein
MKQNEMEQNLPVETFQSVREDNLFKQTVHSGKVPKYVLCFIDIYSNSKSKHVVDSIARFLNPMCLFTWLLVLVT